MKNTHLPSPSFCPFCGNQDILITTSPLPCQNIECGKCGRTCKVDWWNEYKVPYDPLEKLLQSAEEFAAGLKDL